jgi:hypothetical protein
MPADGAFAAITPQRKSRHPSQPRGSSKKEYTHRNQKQSAGSLSYDGPCSFVPEADVLVSYQQVGGSFQGLLLGRFLAGADPARA